MSDRPAIIPDMPIFGSDGAPVGTVHRVSGVRILVNHVGVSEADQHVIPIARVASVTDRVTLDCPAADARAQGIATRVGGRPFVPLAWLAVGAGGIALVYGASTLILRGARDDAGPPASPGVAAVEPADGTAGVPAPARPVVRAGGPQPANRATLAAYLASDAPAAQRFSLDAGFAPGSAALDAAGKAIVRGIAGLMGEHLNTQIKLAASGGGLALRRAASVKALLVASGIAEYRIATGAARSRSAGGSGVELVVLAK